VNLIKNCVVEVVGHGNTIETRIDEVETIKNISEAPIISSQACSYMYLS
jgi:hypothetical protein